MSIETPHGSVHGRFQPLHNDHLEYIRAAMARCSHLWVGITQPDIRHLRLTQHDPHRSARENNPLTYFERYRILMEALSEAGLAADAFSIVPFPIEQPDTLIDYMPTSIRVFTTGL